jgi:isoleucyl-tRNA synthetase
LHEKAKLVLNKIEKMDKNNLYMELNKNKKIELEINGEKIILTKDDFQIVETEKENIARTETENIILLFDKQLTPELEAEGFAREIVRRIQSMRKELDLDVEDRISTQIKVNQNKITALKKWEDYIKGETRSKKIVFVDKPSGKLVKKWNIDRINAEIGIVK